MPKLSPAYREDSYEGLPLDVKEYLDKHFLDTLPDLNSSNPKLLIVFSGGNAVGKSALSQKIARELHGVVVENDEVKLHLLKYNPNIDRDELQRLTWKYTMDLYQRAGKDIKNGLVIRDGVIDWYYDRILPVFENQGYEIFVIAYGLSEQKLTQLITSRGDKPTVSADRLVTLLKDHRIHQQRFRQIYRPDVLLTDEDVFDHDKVVGEIRLRLKKLS